MLKKLFVAGCASAMVIGLSGCSMFSGMQAVPDKSVAPAVNGADILEGPPALKSPGQHADEAAYREGLKMRKTARGQRAAADADMNKFGPLVKNPRINSQALS